MNDNSTYGSLSRKERDRLRNREAILNAAVHLFARNGFNDTKLEDVAALAEFGKGTLYNYFKNKNDLLISAFDYALRKVIEYLDEQLKDIEDPLKRLRLIVKAQFEYYQDNEDFLRVIITNQQVIENEIRGKSGKELHRRFMHFRKMIIAEIQQAIDNGQLKRGKAERYASYISSMIHGQVRSLNNREVKIEDVDPDEIIDIFLTGASNENK